MLGMRWAAANSIPAIYHHHRDFHDGLTQHYASAFTGDDLQLLGRYPTIVTFTQGLARCAARFFGASARIVVIPNWVPARDPKPRGARPPGSPLRIATTARLVPRKGLEVLIDAIARASDQGAALHCTIIGDGPLRMALEERVMSAGAADHVSFAGALHAGGLRAALAGADVFVLASEEEGMPLSLLEAMAAGCPVVATPVGGVPDAVADGVNGLLVPPRDPGCLARALRGLASDAQARTSMGQVSRSRYLERYTEAAVWPRWEALYDSLLRDAT
jgi:glycosyltransferase involved in cell wall biosynthesis